MDITTTSTGATIDCEGNGKTTLGSTPTANTDTWSFRHRSPSVSASRYPDLARLMNTDVLDSIKIDLGDAVTFGLVSPGTPWLGIGRLGGRSSKPINRPMFPTGPPWWEKAQWSTTPAIERAPPPFSLPQKHRLVKLFEVSDDDGAPRQPFSKGARYCPYGRPQTNKVQGKLTKSSQYRRGLSLSDASCSRNL